MTLTRRRLLRAAALGVCALAAASVPGCRGPVREDFDDNLPHAGRVPRLEPVVRDLLRWAALAPSSRNTQPWQVRFTGTRRFVLGVDPARRLDVADPLGRDAIVALGAFLENFMLAARARGLHVDTHVRPFDPTLRELVEVEWSPGPVREYPLERLVTRRTRRAGFATRAIRPADLRALEGPFGGHAAVFGPTTPQGRLLAEGTAESTRLQWRERASRLEWSEWTRWRDLDAHRFRDGLTPEAMEVSGLANWWVRTTYSRSTVLSPSYAARVVDRTRERVRQCGAWLVATVEDDAVAALLAAGARFERMALLLDGLGIAAHPMQQLLEQPQTRESLGGALGLDESPRLILRLGYVAPGGEAVSLRRPVEWFVSA